MKYSYSYKFLQNQKKEKVIKKIAFISGFLLVFQMSLVSLFFNVPFLSADNPPRIYAEKQAISSSCETAEITLTITGAGSPSESRKPIDIIFVIDRSGSMMGVYLKNVKAAVSNFIDEMNFEVSNPDRVAIVSYAGISSDPSQINYSLGSDDDAAKSVLNNPANSDFIEAGGGTCVECGLAAAFGMLGSTGRDQFVILLSDGVANVNISNNVCAGLNCPVTNTECITNAIAQGNNIKNLGVPIYSVGYRLDDISPPCSVVTEDIATQTLKDISSGEADYYLNGDPSNINQVFNDIAYEINDTAGYDVKIVEVLPVEITYIEMISGQEPASVSGQTIIWKFGDMDIGDIKKVKFLASTSSAGYNGLADSPETRVEYFFNNKTTSVYFQVPNINIASCSVFATSTISGYKYEDGNNEASSTDDQIPGDGWVINLFNVTASTTAATTTDVDGYFEFNGLEDGAYRLTENLEGDWM